MSGIDGPIFAKVCQNGHIMKAALDQESLGSTTHCPECGVPGYIRCPSCNEEDFIVDYLDVPDITLMKSTRDLRADYSLDDLDSYCRTCGEPYPWVLDDRSSSLDEFVGLDPELVENGILELFEQGHYQSAVRDAYKVLEIRVREYGGYGQDVTGTTLMKDAFNPNSGPLSFGETASEKEGTLFLYAGAIQAFRNPSSHRYMDLDEQQAHDIISLANLLLQLLEDNHGTSTSG